MMWLTNWRTFHSVHGVGRPQSSSVMAVSLRSNSALAIDSASMIRSVMCGVWHATTQPASEARPEVCPSDPTALCRSHGRRRRPRVSGSRANCASAVVVVLLPVGDHDAGLGQAPEDVDVQALVAD